VDGIASGRHCLTSAVTFLCVPMLVIAWADGLHIDMNFRFSFRKLKDANFAMIFEQEFVSQIRIPIGSLQKS
jgi:hypothetical protein